MPFLLHPDLGWAHAGNEGLENWNFSPDVLAATLIACALYAAGWRARKGRAGVPSRARHLSFFAGVAALFVALESPIDALAEHSFAMHQVQHLLLRGIGPMLIFLAVPQSLVLAGMPVFLRERVLAPLFSSSALRVLSVLFAHPLAATLWLVAVPIFWHLPEYHDRAVLYDPLHYVMHITMLLSALVFFWRVLDPRPAPLGASYGARIVMCWAAIAGTIPLGAYLSLKSVPLYAAYDQKGRIWLGALQDERVGGLVIWIPGCMMFVVLLLVVIRLWSAREERVDGPRRRGLARGKLPVDAAAANRAMALRLVGIVAIMVGGVAVVAILSHILP